MCGLSKENLDFTCDNELSMLRLGCCEMKRRTFRRECLEGTMMRGGGTEARLSVLTHFSPTVTALPAT